ncbi:5'-methylthioadenosine_nucleosidase / S-adenosylhomocysteine nucleosidase [Hexamita inflata]|uniref:adenosylhomocysteine nucleosidase n=1 Tax=Hexamita inflata TaxID=28002 RepID=A0AA86UW52_9EUKA|nr:5'-methylthioadenosine nucleosidase / S-adenosylhomocysteine nucleosidase [Hexamita inflata]CAI9970314.1 5'-methylthioadenosine nucleosidase / S-adenosylhomocysteine nucleosidase [Hexamita inflata]CAI9976317.1 5'-methylthioadenosine nucleosidase / S-adenosylhomocysteine nucleosidase [Hexamita inflata]
MIKPFGLVCATDSEFETLLQNINNLEQIDVSGITFYKGEFQKKQVVICKSGIGKVASAITIPIFYLQFQCQKIIFVGTAAAISPDLRIGDIVVSSGCVHHDFDARLFLEKCVVFSVGKKVIPAADYLVNVCLDASHKFVSSAQIDQKVLDEFQIVTQRIVSGVIVSGDQFISSPEMKNSILEFTPEAQCGEMEGAAVAQACLQFKMDYCIVRVISDAGDSDASMDYDKFCDKLAGVVCFGILKNVVEIM